MCSKLGWVAAAVLAFSSVAVPAAEPIRLAYIAPLSGTFALTFEEGLKQFLAAADDINAHGGVLGGRKLEIVPFDNKGTPQETLVMLNRMTDQDIHYVLATISRIAITINEALTKYNARNPDRPVLYLNYDAREPSLTEDRCSFWHFRFEPHADMNMNAVSDSMVADASIRRVYFLHQDPTKVAYALEGMHYNGPTGESWMRPEDHQLMAAQLITTFVKAG